ncbi:hypothetical protein DPV78_002658 [Talaromyces pinophilus]|nr:hypothetical protein DPV78_002658 [Talaromyces pinophilus]
MSPGIPPSIIASGAGLYTSLVGCVNTLYAHRKCMTRSAENNQSALRLITLKEKKYLLSSFSSPLTLEESSFRLKSALWDWTNASNTPIPWAIRIITMP